MVEVCGVSAEQSPNLAAKMGFGNEGKYDVITFYFYDIMILATT